MFRKPEVFIVYDPSQIHSEILEIIKLPKRFKLLRLRAPYHGKYDPIMVWTADDINLLSIKKYYNSLEQQEESKNA